MSERDPAIESFGIAVNRDSNDPGSNETVNATLFVRPDMANRHGVCHGGVLFLLADTVMDYSTNASLGEGATSFAAHAEIDFVRAGMIGDTLTATGSVADTWGRTNLVDATITNQDGAVVAHFRGRTRTVDTKKRT
jgi:acyl-CoA thioesterase